MDYIVGNNLFLGYIRDKIITVKHKENLKNIKKNHFLFVIFQKTTFIQSIKKRFLIKYFVFT